MTKPKYFPILDSLRFLASMGVFIAHSVAFFKLSGNRLLFGLVMRDAGYYGVVFFYTLSGFLITYLLTQEKKNTGHIAIRSFYRRRILRIWPLYYIIILLSFFVFPHLVAGHPAGGLGNWHSPFLLYLAFLPNIAILGGFYIATCFHTYTIGYEEQFYLFWPFLLRKKGFAQALILACLFLVPVICEIFLQQVNGARNAPLNYILGFVSLSNLPAFVAGALAAFAYVQGEEKWLAIIDKKISAIVLSTLLICLFFFVAPGYPGFVNIVAILFAFLLLHLVRSGFTGGKVGSLLARGGKISYGIYIYHAAALIFVSHCMDHWHLVSLTRPLLTYTLYIGISFCLLLGIANLSYRFVERPFLRLKRNN